MWPKFGNIMWKLRIFTKWGKISHKRETTVKMKFALTLVLHFYFLLTWRNNMYLYSYLYLLIKGGRFLDSPSITILSSAELCEGKSVPWPAQAEQLILHILFTSQPMTASLACSTTSSRFSFSHSETIALCPLDSSSYPAECWVADRC